MFKGLKSLLAGLLGGAALGILFAPKKGEDLRKDLKNEVNSGGTGLDTVKKTVVGMGKDIGGSCKRCSEDIKQSEAYKEGKKKVKKAIKENVPAETRRKAKKTYKKARTAAKKAVSEAKKTAKQIKKEVSKKKKSKK